MLASSELTGSDEVLLIVAVVLGVLQGGIGEPDKFVDCTVANFVGCTVANFDGCTVVKISGSSVSNCVGWTGSVSKSVVYTVVRFEGSSVSKFVLVEDTAVKSVGCTVSVLVGCTVSTLSISTWGGRVALAGVQVEPM